MKFSKMLKIIYLLTIQAEKIFFMKLEIGYPNNKQEFLKRSLLKMIKD